MGASVSNISTDQIRPTAANRDRVEQILTLAEFLPRDQAMLIEQVYDKQTSRSELAALAGMSPRTMSRRIQAIVRRMKTPIYRFVAGREHLLPTRCKPVAQCVVLHGMSLRQAAKATGHSLHEVRQAMHTIRTLMDVYGA